MIPWRRHYSSPVWTRRMKRRWRYWRLWRSADGCGVGNAGDSCTPGQHVMWSLTSNNCTVFWLPHSQWRHLYSDFNIRNDVICTWTSTFAMTPSVLIVQHSQWRHQYLEFNIRNDEFNIRNDAIITRSLTFAVTSSVFGVQHSRWRHLYSKFNFRNDPFYANVNTYECHLRFVSELSPFWRYQHP